MRDIRFNAVELAIITMMRRLPNNWFTTNELADRIKWLGRQQLKTCSLYMKKDIWLKGKRRIGFIGNYINSTINTS